MIVNGSPGSYTLRAKTGRGEENGTGIGWYLGQVELTDNVIFFATCLQSAERKMNGSPLHEKR
jgi:beta-lactamase class D